MSINKRQQAPPKQLSSEQELREFVEASHQVVQEPLPKTHAVRIAVCSDIHDNIWKLERALPGMNQADLLIFCGDFCAPFTLTQMAQGFKGPVHAVLGNNDGDQRLLLQMAEKAGNVTLYGQIAEIEIGGAHIVVNHYPEIARGLAAGGSYDVVCYGHDHTLHQEKIGKTLLINPGEIMGRFGRSTYVIFDALTQAVDVFEVA